MTDVKELEANGYKYFNSLQWEILRSTPHLYQKKVVDGVGIRYFIDVFYYPGHPETHENGFQFETVLYDKDKEPLAQITLYTSDMEKAEQAFSEMWTKLNCGYYE